MSARRPRLAALLLGLLCAAVLLELGLRAACLPRFRTPDETRVFTLYAVGGSTTQGQPFSRRLSFPAIVSAMFSDRARGLPIRVRNLGKGGENIGAQWRRLRRELAFRRRGAPGAVLIYAGLEPGGPWPQAGWAERLSLWFERRVAVRSFFLTDLVQLVKQSRPPRYSRASYEFYLRQTVRLAQDRGLVPVLSTVAANLSDMEPSFLGDERTDPALPVVLEGRRLEAARRFPAAIALYESAASAGEPARPYLIYRAAKCWQALGRYDQAREGFWRAAEGDADLRFWRPSRAQNDLLRRIASESGAVLSDAARLFEESAPHGLLGAEFFMDFHHPNLRGYHLLARGFAEALGTALGERPEGAGWDEEELRRRFSLDDDSLAWSSLTSGRLLLECACTLYPWPDDRLALARRDFAAALRLSPGDSRAALGLSLTQSPALRPLLRDREAMVRLLPRLR
ncbi:MAG: tetratricopeptide repeat protein [Elusimicrobia bacterium]|nr:tetratricopeptide repeat protein [Elusimicrobiota bacterium]